MKHVYIKMMKTGFWKYYKGLITYADVSRCLNEISETVLLCDLLIVDDNHIAMKEFDTLRFQRDLNELKVPVLALKKLY